MSQHSFITALSPIEYRIDDPEGKLRDMRKTLLTQNQDDSPFVKCPMVHFARLQILDKLLAPMGEIKSPPIATRYLLFVADIDGRVDDFLSYLYGVAPEFVQDTWGRCIGYPVYGGAVFLRRYIKRCHFDQPLPYVGFPDKNVQQIREATAVRDQLSKWVGQNKGQDSAALKAAWFKDWHQEGE